MKKFSKIIILVVVLLLVLGVYFLKNGGKNEADTINSTVATAMDNTAVETPIAEENIEKTEEVVKAESTEKKAESRIPMEFTVWDEKALFETGLPLLLDFGSKSCGPCQMMKPDLIAFYEESYGKVTVRYADVWEDPSLTGGFPVSAVPTQFFFNADGTPFEPSVELQKKLRFQMYVRRDNDEHVLTAHVGILTKDQMEEIFREMGADL